MKITLFFCAGNYAETLGIHKVRQMDGAGRRETAWLHAGESWSPLAWARIIAEREYGAWAP